MTKKTNDTDTASGRRKARQLGDLLRKIANNRMRERVLSSTTPARVDDDVLDGYERTDADSHLGEIPK